LICGDFNADNKVLNVIQKISTKRLMIYWKELSNTAFDYNRESDISTELYSQKKICISNSNYQTMKYIFCDTVESLSIKKTKTFIIPESLVDDILRRCKQLKQLCLICCQIKDLDLEKISNKIKQHKLLFTTLNLSFNELTSWCISNLCEILSICKVEEIILSVNKIRNSGAKSLIQTFNNKFMQFEVY